MAARSTVIALALSAMWPAVSIAQGHSTPSPEAVEQMRGQHKSKDWLRITTDSTRYEVRVSVIDSQGLSGVTSAHKAPPAPQRIGWGSIVRIDTKKPHRTRGQLNGLLIGMGSGLIPAAYTSGDRAMYMLLGGLVGCGIGRLASAGNLHDGELYVTPDPPLTPGSSVVSMHATARAESASVSPPSGPVVAASLDSAATDTSVTRPPASAQSESASHAAPAAAVTGPATSFALAASPAVASACRRISSTNLLKLNGDFGTFHGYAARVSPQGLGGLRLESRYPSVRSPGTLAWDRIDRVEVLGNTAGKAALHGAIGVGALAGFVGLLVAAVVTVADSPSDYTGGVIIVGSVVAGATVGAVLGASIGWTIPAWHLVYTRP